MEIRKFDGIAYKMIPELYHNSCEGCQVGTKEECKPRAENDSGEQLECGKTHTIYEKLNITPGKKKKLEL